MKLNLIVLIMLIALPTSAFAGTSDTLTAFAPKEAKLLMGADIDKVRSTMIYKEVFKFLKGSAKEGSALHFVLTTDTFNFDKNVESILVASKAATLNPNGAKPGDSMVVVSGSFDANAVVEAAKKKLKHTMTKKEGFDVAEFAGFELAAVDTTTLILAENKFAKAAWKNAASKTKTGTDKSMKNLLKITNTKRGVWAVASSSAMPSGSGPKMNGSALSASLKSGVDLILVTAMTNAKDAKEVSAQMRDTIKSQGGMAAMFGAKPLVDNLKIVQQKSNVKMTTKMSNKELKAMIKTLKKVDPNALQEKPQGKTAPIPKAPSNPKKGADADFN